jgi:hypothetical protein
MLHGLAAAVRAELLVQVPHVRLDRAHRQFKLAGDIRGAQVGRQRSDG